jgi:hypothetical protein
MKMRLKPSSIEVKNKFIGTDWNYFATMTSNERDASAGSVFMRLRENVERWKEIDPELDYCFWICEHRGAEGGAGRPHIHGAIKSRASRRQLERRHRGGFARLLPFRAPQVMGLYGYIQQQAFGEPITPETMEGIL